MSEQNPTTPEPDPDLAADEPQSSDVAALRSEAKRRRLAQREVEAERDAIAAERDALRGRVDTSDRREVDRVLADRFEVPADAWLDPSFTLDAMRAEDGTIDMGMVEEQVVRLEQERPNWRKQPRTTAGDVHSGARQSVVEPPSIGQAIRKAMRGGG